MNWLKNDVSKYSRWTSFVPQSIYIVKLERKKKRSNRDSTRMSFLKRIAFFHKKSFNYCVKYRDFTKFFGVEILWNSLCRVSGKSKISTPEN